MRFWKSRPKTLHVSAALRGKERRDRCGALFGANDLSGLTLRSQGFPHSGSNRRFEFQKSGQLFIRAHNEPTQGLLYQNLFWLDLSLRPCS
jgi:hypothetical protein